MAAFRVLVFTALAFGFILLKPGFFPPRDFVEYWSAANVLAHGGNPYDGSQLLIVQRAADPEVTDKAVSLWTPPWTLPLYLPFGFLPFAVAHKAWLVVQLLCLGLSVEMLAAALFQGWHRIDQYRKWFYGLPIHLVSVFFSPVFWCLHFGQNTAFILLGLAGFLRFRASKPMLAGVFVALTAIKPHMLAPFGIILIAEALRPPGRRVLFAGIGMLILGSLIALGIDHAVFSQFVEAVRKPSTPDTVSLKDWQVPLLSYHLRQAVNPDWFWVQFLPCLIACLAAVGYYANRRSSWDWNVELPRLVVLSLLAAPYGAWMFDLTLLMVPAFVCLATSATSTSRIAKLVYIVGLPLLSEQGLMIRGLAEAWWFTPVFAVLYLWVETVHRKESPCRGTIAL